MRDRFGLEVPIRALFEEATIAEFAQRIETALGVTGTAREIPLSKVSRAAELPLSFAQQRLWFLQQLMPEDPFYNMGWGLRLTGALDDVALEVSLQKIIARHETLRTCFVTVQGRAVQQVAPSLEWHLGRVDLSTVVPEQAQGVARQLLRAEAVRPFDLGKAPLFRALLIKLAEDSYILWVAMHHIVSDGWSMGILLHESAVLYQSLVSGEPAPLPELSIEYVDFAMWQRRHLQGEILQKQVGYWQKQLADLTLLRLPADHPRPAIQSFRGAKRTVIFSADLTQALRKIAGGKVSRCSCPCWPVSTFC